MAAGLVPSPSLLPLGFADLEPFVEPWGLLETQDARYGARITSNMAALQAFYDAMSTRMQDIFALLDAVPITQDLDAQRTCLWRMALSITEVVQAVEVFRQPAVPHVDPGDAIHTDWHQGPRSE
jgi:hypothetical protein